MGGARMTEYTLGLGRHGESEGNEKGLFTGWYDADLNDTGRAEAKAAGVALKAAGLKFDAAYTSVLKRAIKTCWTILEEMDLCWIPVTRDYRLNERMYGGLTGMDKKKTVEEHGMEQVKIWRRSFDVPPPDVDTESEYYPGNDPKYAKVDPALLPKSECLKDTIERALPCWNECIVPDIKSGKTLILAMHGNSIRAICKHLDNIPDDMITGLEIPTGIPLVYTLDADMKPIKDPKAVGLLSARFEGDPEAVAKAQEKVANQIKK